MVFDVREQEVEVKISASETVETLLSLAFAAGGIGPFVPSEYFLCPCQPTLEDDALALGEIMTWEMDKLSLVDTQIRALRQQFGVSGAGTRTPDR